MLDNLDFFMYCEGIAQECYAQCDNKVSGTFKLTR